MWHINKLNNSWDSTPQYKGINLVSCNQTLNRYASKGFGQLDIERVVQLSPANWGETQYFFSCTAIGKGVWLRETRYELYYTAGRNLPNSSIASNKLQLLLKVHHNIPPFPFTTPLSFHHNNLPLPPPQRATKV